MAQVYWFKGGLYSRISPRTHGPCARPSGRRRRGAGASLNMAAASVLLRRPCAFRLLCFAASLAASVGRAPSCWSSRPCLLNPPRLSVSLPGRGAFLPSLGRHARRLLTQQLNAQWACPGWRPSHRRRSCGSTCPCYQRSPLHTCRGGGASANVEPLSSFPWRRSCCRRLIRGTASHQYGPPYSASLPLGGGDGTLAATCCAVAGGASHAPDGQVGLSAAAASGRQLTPAHHRTRQLAHCQPRFPAIHPFAQLAWTQFTPATQPVAGSLFGRDASILITFRASHARAHGWQCRAVPSAVRPGPLALTLNLWMPAQRWRSTRSSTLTPTRQYRPGRSIRRQRLPCRGPRPLQLPVACGIRGALRLRQCLCPPTLGFTFLFSMQLPGICTLTPWRHGGVIAARPHGGIPPVQLWQPQRPSRLTPCVRRSWTTPLMARPLLRA